MIFFFIVLSICILLFVAAIVREGFAVWFTFCALLWAWAIGVVIFVGHHFIVKYW